jgi:hypothetical protein
MINTKQTCFPGSSGWFENTKISAAELQLKNLLKTARRFFSRFAFISVAEKFASHEMQSAAESAAATAAIGTGLNLV